MSESYESSTNDESFLRRSRNIFYAAVYNDIPNSIVHYSLKIASAILKGNESTDHDNAQRIIEFLMIANFYEAIATAILSPIACELAQSLRATRRDIDSYTEMLHVLDSRYPDNWIQRKIRARLSFGCFAVFKKLKKDDDMREMEKGEPERIASESPFGDDNPYESPNCL